MEGFLKEFGIFSKGKITSKRVGTATSERIEQWENLAQLCFKLSGSAYRDFTLPKTTENTDKCPLCSDQVKTASVQHLQKHKCLSDDLYVPLKKIDTRRDPHPWFRHVERTKPAVAHEAKKVEPILMLERNVRTLGKVLAMDGPNALNQLFSSTPIIRTKAFPTAKYTAEIQTLEGMLHSGFDEHLDKLAFKMDQERKQIERRVHLARKALRSPLKLIDIDEADRCESSNKALVTTPVRNSSLQDILPLSVSKVSQPIRSVEFVGPVNCYRKTLWRDRFIAVSPDKKSPTFLNKGMDTPKQLAQKAVELQDSSNTPQKVYQNEAAGINNTKQFNLKFEDDNMETKQQHTRKPRLAENLSELGTPRRGRAKRKVQFSLGETPDSNHVNKKANMKYRPRFCNINSGMLLPTSAFTNSQVSFKFPKFLIKKLLAEKAFGVRSFENLTEIGAIKGVEERKSRTEKIKSYIDFDDLMSSLPMNLKGQKNLPRLNAEPLSTPAKRPKISDSSSIFITKNSPLNVQPCGVALNCVDSTSAVVDVGKNKTLSPEEKQDLLFGKPKVTLSTILTKSPVKEGSVSTNIFDIFSSGISSDNINCSQGHTDSKTVKPCETLHFTNSQSTISKNISSFFESRVQGKPSQLNITNSPVKASTRIPSKVNDTESMSANKQAVSEMDSHELKKSTNGSGSPRSDKIDRRSKYYRQLISRVSTSPSESESDQDLNKKRCKGDRRGKCASPISPKNVINSLNKSNTLEVNKSPAISARKRKRPEQGLVGKQPNIVVLHSSDASETSSPEYYRRSPRQKRSRGTIRSSAVLPQRSGVHVDANCNYASDNSTDFDSSIEEIIPSGANLT